MTLDQLRIFVAVAEREHLTQAAIALHLTPSAVSAAIQALEHRYGANLFHRVGRRIELSADGRGILVEARATLASARDTEQALRELGGLTRGRLAIAASQTIVSYWLPRALMHFAVAYPVIAIDLGEGNTTSVVAAVLEGRAELGFIEGVIDEPALAVTAIDEDRLVIVGTPENPLTRRPVQVAELAAVPWVMREAGSGTRAAFEAAMRAAGVEPAALRIALQLPTNEAVCAAVRGTPCLTVVSDLVARPHMEAGRLRRVRYDLPTRSFALLRHKERYRTKASLAFTAMLQEEIVRARAARDEASYDI